jgi:KTSC domain
MAIKDRFSFKARQAPVVARPETPESHRRRVSSPGAGYIPDYREERAPGYVSVTNGPWNHVEHDEDFTVDYISQGVTGPREPSADWGDNENFDSKDIPWSVRPSSTSNPSRPRTRALGYDPETQTMRIEFRGGAVYDYPNITKNQWDEISAAWSPGKWINRNIPAGAEYDRLS